MTRSEEKRKKHDVKNKSVDRDETNVKVDTEHDEQNNKGEQDDK